MKIRLFPFAAIAVVMASCSNEDVMELNPDPAGDALSFSIAVSHSRATETTVNNLGDFRVVARGIHPHGGLYDSYLIGTSTEGEIAKRSSNNIWKLQKNVYWPTSMTSAVFWAYTFAQSNGTNTDILPEGVNFTFGTGNTPVISGFTPVKADLKKGATDGYWNDGASQTDMLVAFTQHKRSSTPSVAIEFGHALSQIDIKAKSAGKLDDDNRIVRIKGAWIVNTNNVAEISAGFKLSEDDTDGIKTATVDTVWSKHSIKDGFSAYGSFYKTPKLLGKDNAENAEQLLGSSLMIIPQKLEAWGGKGDESTNKSYILLLCRVELEHNGTSHSGSDNIDDVEILGDKHYHQQFPVNSENKFDESEYGFVCVPVGTEFKIGKKYCFTLDICGKATGAGVYPPDFNETMLGQLIPTDIKFGSVFKNDSTIDLKIVKRDPNGTKVVGDPVLDEPITFSVSVSGWAEDDKWTDGKLPL